MEEFVQQNNLTKLPEDEAFEQFCGYLATATHYSETFSSEDIATGSGNDCGIDTISIIANGTLVTDPDEIDDLCKINGYIDVTFVFVQAKRSPTFSTEAIGQFCFGVNDFFAIEPQLKQNESIKLYAKISNEIFRHSKQFKKGNPRCILYYATTGRNSEDQNVNARISAEKKSLMDLGLFREVLVECLGADELQKMYRNSQTATSVEVLFLDKTVIPEVPGVEQAYLGLLPVKQFLKIIENESGDVRNNIFYDNVRHWQDWNPVNSEIRATLADVNFACYFPIMNNGVTIVASRVRPTGNKFLIEEFQIVNGCQTSYAVHECKENLNDTVMVPVRLIATNDDRIKRSIIKATNRQTEVSEDQLFAISDFSKKLEMFFQTFDGKERLYYERRSRQYSGVQEVERVRVITMTTLVRAFASIFLELPHRTTRNYKALIRTIGTDIFNETDRLEPYYVAAYAHYRLDFLFRNQLISPELKPARYHLLLAYRLLCFEDEKCVLPRINSKEMLKFCELILKTLWDDIKYKEIFSKAAEIVTMVADNNLHRDNIRTEAFTAKLLTALKK